MRRLTARRRVAAAAAGLALAACASPGGGPPGGPPDEKPPGIVRILPESAATGVRSPRVVFEFDEVVSERPQGAVSLNGIFLLSPRDGEPRVRWQRDAITIRPRRGWRRNTVYTVTMLPGLVDLRSNVRRTGAATVFSTGGAIPATRITGAAFDWITGLPAGRALVEAIARPDSTVYIALADSLGRFMLAHLPPGDYTVLAYVDANNNRSRDVREPFDSARVTLVDSATTELLAFVHDTLGPRIDAAAPLDSLALRVAFDKPLDPAQQLTLANFALLRADSTAVPLAGVQSKTAYDSSVAASSPDRRLGDSLSADTARHPSVRPSRLARPDTARRPPPVASRPSPAAEVVLRLAVPLAPGESYRLRAIDVRNLVGRARTSERVVTIPGAAPVDTTRPPAPADTTRGRAPRR